MAIPILKTVTAENQFSDALKIPALTDPQKKTAFSLDIWGTFVAIVTLQYSFDNEVTWLDLDPSFTEPGRFLGNEIESNIKYRVGVKTGDFTSGPVQLRLAVN